MSYPNDFFVADPNNNKLYKFVNDAAVTTGFPIDTPDKPMGILVDQNKKDVWVTNSGANTVSVISNGEIKRDIPVGRRPMAITQIKDGTVYVANFMSNTISVIKNYAKVKDIRVGKWPRDLCTDPNNNVWVSNFGDNTVNKISGTTVTHTIGVSVAPFGICSDKKGNIWVACSGSNRVVKITHESKVADISVGKVPYGICCDKNNGIWVANYYSNTVSKITGVSVAKTLEVGKGPYNIAATTDSLYVYNYLDTTVSKIALQGEVVTDHITACYNNIGIGDPTGFEYYLMFVLTGTSSGGSGDITGTVGFDRLSEDVQNMLNSAAKVPLDSANVTFNGKPLNEILEEATKKPGSIVGFSNDITIAEKGTEITMLTLNWEVEGDLKSAVITGPNSFKDNTSVIASPTGSLTITDSAVLNADKMNDMVFTLTIIDSADKTATMTTTVKRAVKAYYGATTKESGFKSADIIALDGQLINTDEKFDLAANVNCTGGKYILVAFPESLGYTAEKMLVGSTKNNAWETETVTVTTDAGVETVYTVMRSTYIQYSPYLVVDVE